MKMTIGMNIKHLRTAKNITQEQLSVAMNVTCAAVSKWERGETYPDITLLQPLAYYFGVSTDELLDFNQFEMEKEKEIEAYVEKYWALWHENDHSCLLETMKEAVSHYPEEHRLLVRYLNAINLYATDACYSSEMKKEAITIYERILSHCTVDSIRIWAKKIMCEYFKKLSRIKESGVTIKDIEKIQSEMPLMQNSRDYLACFVYTDEKKDTISRAAIAELSFLMNNVIIDNWVYNPIYTTDEKIVALETLIEINSMLYKNEDYGKNARNAVYALMHLGCFYHEKGETEKAQNFFRKSLALAKKLDNSDDLLTHTEGLLAGVSLDKIKIPAITAEPLVQKITSYITRYKKIPLSLS